MFNRTLIKFFYLFTSILLVLFITACSNSGQTSSEGSSPDSSESGESSGDNVIKIGQIFSLSGGAAVYGIPEQNDAELFLEEINKEGVEIGGETYKFEAVTYDDSGQGNQTVNLVKRLVEQDGVNIIAGGTVSDALIAAAPTVESYNGEVIFIASAVSNPKVSEGNPHMFTTYYNLATTGDVVGNWVIENRGYENIAILQEKIENAETYANGWKRATEKQGKNLVAHEFFDTGASNLATQITNILSKDPDIIAVAAYADAGPISVKQIRQAGYDGPLAVYGGALIPAVSKGIITKEDIEGVLEGDPVLLPQLVEMGNENAVEFHDRYVERYGEAAITVGMARDGLQILINAMKLAGTTTDVAAITEALKTGSAEDLNKDLIMPNRAYEDGRLFGHEDSNIVQKEFAMKEYRDGTPVVLEILD